MKIFWYANKMIKTVGIDILQQWVIAFNLCNGEHDFLMISLVILPYSPILTQRILNDLNLLSGAQIL